MSRPVLRSFTAMAVLAACLPATLAAPMAQATSAPTSAYAVIGSITVPGVFGQLVIDTSDDTLYAASFEGMKLATIAPGATGGVPVSTVSLPNKPGSMAIDSNDDSIYIIQSAGGNGIWVSPGGKAVTRTIRTTSIVQGIAVNSMDDTVYGTRGYQFGDDAMDIINGRNPDDSVVVTGVGWGTSSLAVDQQDDTVWMAGNNSFSVRTLRGSTRQVVNVPGVYAGARDVAVSSADHLAYVATTVSSAPTLQKVAQSGSIATWSNSAATGSMNSISLNPAGTRAVFSTGSLDDSLWIIDTSTMQADGPALAMPRIGDTAQALSGLIYVAPKVGTSMLVLAKVQGSLSSATAQPGDALTVTILTNPSTAANQPVSVDDSTLSSISFGGFPASVSRIGVNTFTVTVPAGPSGTVEAVATLAGGAPLSLGNVSISTPTPTPAPPPMPASAPGSVTAEGGDRSAVVSWAAPESTGSFLVTTYQVTSSPGGRSCLTDELSCTIDGLANGTAYTFTVRALTGAGWSAASEPSNVVVPRGQAGPSITITGSRDGSRIEVLGTTVGFGMGGMLRPWLRFPGQSTYSEGAATILVSMDGTFEWGRRTGKRVSVYVQTPDATVRSNTVVIPAP